MQDSDINNFIYMKQLILMTFSLLYSGCIKEHKSTTKICGGQLYVETFNVNPAGVDEDYLTDSLSFRIFVGKFDNEHENFSYVCNGDSIRIMKLAVEASGRKMKITESKLLSLADLKNKKISINKALFEFK
jgi:hypothetical protein